MRTKISRSKIGFSILLAMGIGLSYVSTAANAADTPVYKNMFIAYYSPQDVAQMADYVQKKQLSGFILWEFRGDMPYPGEDSLLNAVNKNIKGYKVSMKPPLVMGYWTDWSVYVDGTARAIPEPTYAVPNSLDTNSKPVTNEDFSNKLAGMNVVAYSFVEAQAKNLTYYDNTSGKTITYPNQTPNKIGTLYFNDPWADLYNPKKSNAAQNTLCGTSIQGGSPICWYALTNRIQPIMENGSLMGNFPAFSQLKHQDANNPLGPLKKVISVGGYGHDDTFEDMFNFKDGITNFVQSAKSILQDFNIDGIDLDYENPEMTPAQSTQYLKFVNALREALPDKLITVTILADPDYMNGVRGGKYGFAPGVLKSLGALANHIDLMTYDFHGAFDYKKDNTGTTGFLTNLYMPSNAPAGYKFSVDTSVQALIDSGVPADKISVGIPAYGRALAGIAAGDTGGLFQPITAAATIPRGDMDAATCDTQIANLGPNSCSGSFQYSMINKMLKQGFTAAQHFENRMANGITAYAAEWAPVSSPSYSLEILSDPSSTVGFNVSVGSFTAPDFFNAGTEKVYSGPATAGISGQSNLPVNWTAWVSGQCEQPLDFKENMKVTIKATADNGQGLTSCTFSPLSASGKK